jgi:hypothetical protein
VTQPVGGRDGWFAEVPPRDDEAPGARRAVHAGCPDGALERPYRAQPCRSVERRRFSRADIPPAGQKLRVAPALCRHKPPLQPLNPRSRCATALCQTRLESRRHPIQESAKLQRYIDHVQRGLAQPSNTLTVALDLGATGAADRELVSLKVVGIEDLIVSEVARPLA